jgi:cytochrome P450
MVKDVWFVGSKCYTYYSELIASFLNFNKGDIIYLNMAGTPIIILNSLEATSPLFESKSSIYSNRATLPFSTDIVGWRELMIFQPDGPHLKEHRRLFAHTMGSKAALERFAPLIEAETCCFLQRVLDQPNASCLSDHVRK